MRKITIPALLLAACLLHIGCSSARVFQTSGPAAPVETIADISVTLQPGRLSRGAEAFYDANSMSGAIRSALLKELRRKGKFDSKGAIIEFSVTDFRLRSGFEVLMIGNMAGGDYLAGTVTVKQGGTVLKTFQASAKGSQTWVTGRISANSRADLFCRLIARKIVEQL